MAPGGELEGLDDLPAGSERGYGPRSADPEQAPAVEENRGLPVGSSGYRAAQDWWVNQIRGTMPEARLVTIEGGTHDFIAEFDQTVDEVQRFLGNFR